MARTYPRKKPRLDTKWRAAYKEQCRLCSVGSPRKSAELKEGNPWRNSFVKREEQQWKSSKQPSKRSQRRWLNTRALHTSQAALSTAQQGCLFFIFSYVPSQAEALTPRPLKPPTQDCTQWERTRFFLLPYCGAPYPKPSTVQILLSQGMSRFGEFFKE